MTAEVFGWAGSFLLSVASIPQAIQSYKQGHSEGLSTAMIWLWGAGMMSAMIYVTSKTDLPLMFNYGFNLVTVWATIAWFKHFPRSRD
jgi:uncharacterized protein with PQ loop repeat